MKRFNKKEWMKEYDRKYSRRYMKVKYAGYGGACFCLKCGKWGYKYYRRSINLKTGTEHGIFTVMIHEHMEHRERVYDGFCYIGMGKL